MKLHLIRMLGVAALVVPLGAWAQQEPEKSSLDVTMEVVPFAQEINLSETVPIDADASSEGVANSQFGRATAFRAQQGGREFGEAVSGAASANAGQPGFTVPKPPAP